MRQKCYTQHCVIAHNIILTEIIGNTTERGRNTVTYTLIPHPPQFTIIDLFVCNRPVCFPLRSIPTIRNPSGVQQPWISVSYAFRVIRDSDWLRAGRPKGRSSSPGTVKIFLFSTSLRQALEPTQTSHPKGSWSSFPGGKAAEPWSWSLTSG
jgi:hypothetical protein